MANPPELSETGTDCGSGLEQQRVNDVGGYNL